MSRAFVNEDNAAAQIDPPVERQISAQINYVTQRGFDQLHVQVEQLQAQYSEQNAQGDDADKQRMAEIERDLRYFNQRLQSAQVVSSTSEDKVQIGSWVTFADEDSVEQRVQLVGEDQADAASQLDQLGVTTGQGVARRQCRGRSHLETAGRRCSHRRHAD